MLHSKVFVINTDEYEFCSVIIWNKTHQRKIDMFYKVGILFRDLGEVWGTCLGGLEGGLGDVVGCILGVFGRFGEGLHKENPYDKQRRNL